MSPEAFVRWETVKAQTWINAICQTLGNSFVLLQRKQLVGIVLCIFVKRELLRFGASPPPPLTVSSRSKCASLACSYVTNLADSYVSTGMAGWTGNKVYSLCECECVHADHCLLK
jgi:hypothetical protein